MNGFVSTLISMSIGGSAAALLFFVLKPLVKRSVSRTFMYYIWLVVLLRLIVPVSATHGFDPLAQPLPNDSHSSAVFESKTAPCAPVGSSGTETHRTDISEQAEQTSALYDGAALAASKGYTISWQNMVAALKSNAFVIWLTGFGASLAWLVCTYALFRLRLRSDFIEPNAADKELFASLCRSLCIKKKVRLMYSSAVKTPLLAGVIRPTIILPQIAYSKNGMTREFSLMVSHELVHLKRRDTLYKWFAALVVCIHWFNPLVYIIRREMGHACELACDEALVKNMAADEVKLYGNMLIAASCSNKAFEVPTTSFCESKRNLKERLVSIMNYKKKGALAAVLSLALILMISGCAAVIGPNPNSAESEDDLQMPLYANKIPAMPRDFDGDGIDDKVFIITNIDSSTGKAFFTVSVELSGSETGERIAYTHWLDDVFSNLEGCAAPDADHNADGDEVFVTLPDA